ncbi:MAG TPA: 6-carboxytetrahydropterin synthase [Sphingobacterium sp.]|nr:6-carboxytetrahydropterin synthase [Sphingobacterium sp.]
MIYLTRRERFSAAHKLYREEWSDEKNEEVFGKCSNPNWHGHNYVLYVTVNGDVDPETGFVMNLKKMKKIITEHIIDKVDHKNLNLDVDFMKDKMPSTENIAIEIFKILEPVFKEKKVNLHSVRLHETENNFVEYFGK